MGAELNGFHADIVQLTISRETKKDLFVKNHMYIIGRKVTINKMMQ